MVYRKQRFRNKFEVSGREYVVPLHPFQLVKKGIFKEAFTPESIIRFISAEVHFDSAK